MYSDIIATEQKYCITNLLYRTSNATAAVMRDSSYVKLLEVKWPCQVKARKEAEIKDMDSLWTLAI